MTATARPYAESLPFWTINSLAAWSEALYANADAMRNGGDSDMRDAQFRLHSAALDAEQLGLTSRDLDQYRIETETE